VASMAHSARAEIHLAQSGALLFSSCEALTRSENVRPGDSVHLSETGSEPCPGWSSAGRWQVGPSCYTANDCAIQSAYLCSRTPCVAAVRQSHVSRHPMSLPLQGPMVTRIDIAFWGSLEQAPGPGMHLLESCWLQSLAGQCLWSGGDKFAAIQIATLRSVGLMKRKLSQPTEHLD